MTTLCTLASGSSGNATLVSAGSTHILIDAGISVRRINTALKALGLSIADLSALLITHSHSDHVSALTTLLKHYAPSIYASNGTAFDLRNRFSGISPLLCPFTSGDRQSDRFHRAGTDRRNGRRRARLHYVPENRITTPSYAKPARFSPSGLIDSSAISRRIPAGPRSHTREPGRNPRRGWVAANSS